MKNHHILPTTKKLKETAALIAFSLTASLAYSSALDFEKSFESGLGMNCSGNCPVISRTYAREGSSSMRSYVNRNTSQNSYRAEAVIPGDVKKLKFSRDYWYGFSAYLPEDWQVTGNNEVIAQFHASNDPGETNTIPPVEIKTGNGNWQILSKGEGDPRGGGKTWNLNSVWEDVGKWTDWVIHYKPSYGSDGVLRVWKNGALVAQRYGKNTYKDQIGPYFKMGMYLSWKDRECCNPNVYEKTIYHDALRIASGPNAGYFDVAPRGDATNAQPSGSNESISSNSKMPILSAPAPNPNSATSLDSEQAYINITNLTSKQRVSGKTNVIVDAQDSDDGIRRVFLRAEDKTTDTVVGSRTQAPWEFVLDTKGYSPGSIVRLKAVMLDGKGNRVHSVVRVVVE